MGYDPRIMAYRAAAIQGMLAAEQPNIELSAVYIAERTQEIINCCIAIEDGEELPDESDLTYGSRSLSPISSTSEPAFGAEEDCSPELSRHIHLAGSTVSLSSADSSPSSPDPDPTALQAVWQGSDSQSSFEED